MIMQKREKEFFSPRDIFGSFTQVRSKICKFLLNVVLYSLLGFVLVYCGPFEEI